LVLGLAAAAAACSKNAALDQHLARGDTLAREQRIPDAIVEYRQAARNDDKNARASHRLGLAYLRLGELSQAYGSLLAAIKLEPDNSDVRLRLASIDLISARRDQARDQARTLLDKDSVNADALVLLSATATPGDVDDVIRQLEASMPHLGRNAQTRLALGALYWRKRDTSAAHRILGDAVAGDSSSLEGHLLLSRFYSATGNPVLAEREAKRASAIAPPGALSRLAAVERLLALGQRDQAASALNEVTEKNDADPTAWRFAGNLAFSDGRLDDGARAVARLAQLDTSDVEGIVLSGRLHLARQEYPQAIADFQRALRVDHRVAPVHYYLAAALLQSGKTSEAKTELESAVSLAPDYSDAVFQLAELNLRDGAPDAARAALDRFVGSNPQSIKGHVLLGTALAATGHATEATEAFQQILRIAPKSVEGHYWVGIGLLAERRRDEAKREFQTALTMAPEFQDAIVQLVLMDLAEKNPDVALRRVRSQMAAVPRSADLYDLLGLVQVSRNELDSAEVAFLKSIELNSRLLDPRVRLAELYFGMERLDRALVQAESAASIDSRNLRALMALGVAAQQTGDVAKARHAYETALAVDPRFSGAANNLAMLLSDQGDDAAALKFALQAQQASPEDPHVLDTLGWILYKRGEYERAVKLLTQSASAIPESPSVQYHLGMAAQKAGDTMLARSALGRAVNSTTPFAEKNEARRALQLLR
jgi:tetratricopeptide (TPR) repeat protein